MEYLPRQCSEELGADVEVLRNGLLGPVRKYRGTFRGSPGPSCREPGQGYIGKPIELVMTTVDSLARPIGRQRVIESLSHQPRRLSSGRPTLGSEEDLGADGGILSVGQSQGDRTRQLVRSLFGGLENKLVHRPRRESGRTTPIPSSTRIERVLRRSGHPDAGLLPPWIYE